MSLFFPPLRTAMTAIAHHPLRMESAKIDFAINPSLSRYAKFHALNVSCIFSGLANNACATVACAVDAVAIAFFVIAALGLHLFGARAAAQYCLKRLKFHVISFSAAFIVSASALAFPFNVIGAVVTIFTSLRYCHTRLAVRPQAQQMANPFQTLDDAAVAMGLLPPPPPANVTDTVNATLADTFAILDARIKEERNEATKQELIDTRDGIIDLTAITQVAQLYTFKVWQRDNDPRLATLTPAELALFPRACLEGPIVLTTIEAKRVMGILCAEAAPLIRRNEEGIPFITAYGNWLEAHPNLGTAAA